MENQPAPFTGDTMINGFRWPPITCEDMPEQLRKFEVRDNDVFIVTYPKSGTHWTTEIMKNILCGGDLEKVNEEYGDHIPPIEFFDFFKKCTSFPTEKPRIMKTHAPVDVLPKELFEGKGKAVFVMRNPKDTAVSYWHFLRERRFLEEYDKWENFLPAFLKPDMMGGSWFDVSKSYYEHRNAKNFLFLTYEEMKLDHKGCVVQLCDFVSRPLSDDQVEQIVQNTTFSSMKTKFTDKLPTVTINDLPKLAALGDKKQKFTLMRKGVVGDWKTQFTVAENEFFDEVYNEKMKGSPLTKRMIFEIA